MTPLDEVIDVLVVGAGSAGAGVAWQLARRGWRVLLVDRRLGATREGTPPGARWVNAVPAWCFDDAGLERPRGDELWKHGGTFRMVAPGGGATVAHDGRAPVLHVDMRHLVARLLRGAEAAGAGLLAASVTDVALDPRGRVASATLDPARVVRPRLVIDASGLGGAVRERVPALRAACPRVGPDDLCLAAEHQFRVREPGALRELLARHGAMPGDDVGFPGTCGGYSTLTLFTRPELDEVGVLAGSIPATGAPPGPAMIDTFVAGAPWIGERLFGGQAAIPVRRPYDTLGAGGVALVGDAACQVFPSHGSGVGLGLVAGRLLADAVAGAADPGADAVLLAYERTFRRRHGGTLAASDAFRRFAQREPARTSGDLMRSGLVDAEAFSQALAQQPLRPSARSLARVVAGAVRAPGLALRMGPIVARTAVLEPLGGVHARGVLGRAIGAVVDRLTGPATGAPAPVFVHPADLPPSRAR